MAQRLQASLPNPQGNQVRFRTTSQKLQLLVLEIGVGHLLFEDMCFRFYPLKTAVEFQAAALPHLHETNGASALQLQANFGLGFGLFLPRKVAWGFVLVAYPVSGPQLPL